MFDRVTDDGDYPDVSNYHKWLSNNRIFQAKKLDLDENLTYPDLMRSFVEQLYGQKSVLGINVHRNFQRIPMVFPDAKYIHLLRDPRDVARSCIGMGWVGHVYYGADIWMDAERSWNQLKSSLNNSQYLEIKYEDLLSDNVATLTAICEFVGVNYSERMMDYADRSSYDLPDKRFSLQWKKKYSTRELRLVEGKIGQLIVDSGYELSGLSPVIPGRLERMVLSFQNKAYRVKFNIGKYGLMLYLERCLSDRLGWRSWRDSCQERINQIDIMGLK